MTCKLNIITQAIICDFNYRVWKGKFNPLNFNIFYKFRRQNPFIIINTIIIIIIIITIITF